MQTSRHLRYAFRELFDEISWWLVLGIVLSGVIAAALPPDIFERYLNDPWAAMLVMLIIGIPLYTCASAATPVMATLVLKGLNPGAALVFLLAGPATSLGSMTVWLKFLGLRVLTLYLASIAAVSLLAGVTLELDLPGAGDRSARGLRYRDLVRPRAAQGRGRACPDRAARAQHAPHPRADRVALAARPPRAPERRQTDRRSG